MSNRTYYLALDLKDDDEAIRQYEEYHRAVWPEIIASIKESGIVHMEIYRAGNRLFMVMEVDESFSPERKGKADRENPRVQQWEELMDKFQQRLPFANAGEKWVVLDKIFQL